MKDKSNDTPPPQAQMVGSEVKKIALLEERIASLEEELDEARQVPWPEWSTKILKLVRSYSGYDGYDDATEGVDLVAEVEEALCELASEAEKHRSSDRFAALEQALKSEGKP